MPKFENLFTFLRTLRHDTIIFGEFVIDTIKESKIETDYENILRAYDFEQQISVPTGVTTAATCLDYDNKLSNNYYNHQDNNKRSLYSNRRNFCSICSRAVKPKSF